MGEEQAHLLSNVISNNSCRHFTLKETKCNFPLLKYELLTVTSNQRVKCGERRKE